MMNWTMIAVAGVAVVGFLAIAMPKSPKGYAVRAPSAKELAASRAVVVDIRRPEEWRATGVIKGARLITFAGADGFLAQLGALPEGAPLVLICHSGRRSAAAAAALAGKVANPIISYQGGMSAWIDAKGAIAKPKP